ncbi:hypothetical protein BXOR1_19730 [Xanthomonas oryzae pv. oryzicola]|nr:hypothetical protein FE36_20385 [Xanthomonas oryzae pv. oryzicola]OLI44936.1 hypothetical protein IXO141_04800 [Xanthomonas oryzae pv. oryzae]AKO02007.1 hypothetical protein ACU15_17415 [Xanthomonas oryzae pv. oryzicola]OLI98069.1 hypothetical protein IXO390_00410 [Xanthomonas oryzae pv. oryzae]OLI98828.1 hypothetical protein IXO222_11020 [Xanthomonas oryzae pv. oryzae]
MAAWHWAGLAISREVLQLKVRANQEMLKASLQLTWDDIDFLGLIEWQDVFFIFLNRGRIFSANNN